MDGGINAPLPLPLPLPLPRPLQRRQQPHQHDQLPPPHLDLLHTPADADSAGTTIFPPPPPSPSPSPSPSSSPSPHPPRPLSLLTTSNLEAASANGHVRDLGAEGDPDAFYRVCQGARQGANGPHPTSDDNMAATAASPRLNQASVRPNGSGTAPKNSSTQSPYITAPYRSVSSTLDDRQHSKASLPGVPSSQRPNVKDLLKKFDKSNEPALRPAQNPNINPLGVRAKAGDGPSYMKDRAGYMARSASAQSAVAGGRGGTREPAAGAMSPSSSQPSQRNRFAAEDQLSNNALASAARTARTPAATGTPPPLHAQGPSDLIERRPLFGEVIGPEEDFSYAGYGIPTAAQLSPQTSPQTPAFLHQRSKSDVDSSSSSSPAQSRGERPGSGGIKVSKTGKVAHGRASSGSTAASSSPRSGVATHQSFLYSNPRDHPKLPDSEAIKGNTRLPVATKRLSNPSSDTSPASARSNSPIAAKKMTDTKSRQPWSPAGAKMPAGRTTPSQQSSRFKAKAPEGSAPSLKAYVSVPLSQRSPPLRSSRPRDAVPGASNPTHSRPAPNGSAAPGGMKITRRVAGEPTRSRKVVDTGPVDFGAARGKVMRAYTKTMNEEEQKNVRAANLRRLSERQSINVDPAVRDEEAERATPPSELAEAKPRSPGRLRISTSFATSPASLVLMEAEAGIMDEDSPTLGMPGTFVDEDVAPASAVSIESGTTEIENEAQTEAAHQAVSPRDLSVGHERHENLLPEAQDAENLEGNLNDGSLSPVTSQQDSDLLRHHRPNQDPTTGFLRGCSWEDVSASGQQEAVHDYRTSSEAMHFNSGGMDEAEAFYTQGLASTLSSQSEHVPRLDLPTLRRALSSSPPSPEVNHLENAVQSGSEKPVVNGAGPHDDPYGPSYDQSREVYRLSGSHVMSRSSGWTDDTFPTSEDVLVTDNSFLSRPISEDTQAQPILSPQEALLQFPARAPPIPPKPDAYISPEPSPALPDPAAGTFNRYEGPHLTSGNSIRPGIAEDPVFGVAAISPWSDYSLPATPALLDTFQAPKARPEPLVNRSAQRPESSTYQSSHNDASRNAESRRASEDAYSHRGSVSTPRSSTHISVEETPNQSPEALDQEAAAAVGITDTNDVTHLPTISSEATIVPDRLYETPQERKRRDKLTHRKHAIQELINTEAVYLKDMNVVEEIYKGTAEACPRLSDGDVKLIFRNSKELVNFTTKLYEDLKLAAASVYVAKRPRKEHDKGKPSDRAVLSPNEANIQSLALLEELDKKTSIGECFCRHTAQMHAVYNDFLKDMDEASSRLLDLQTDSNVKVWLGECNTVAQDLTAAWSLDSLLVKPLQRITRYKLMLEVFINDGGRDHPDYAALMRAWQEIVNMTENINRNKDRIQTVSKIISRKRKESNSAVVSSSLTKAWARRRELSSNRINDDLYVSLQSKFNDDYLRLQVVLRDVEFYTRQIPEYVNQFLRLLAAIEILIRFHATQYPELESKWAHFNASMKDMGSFVLESHIAKVRSRVILPFETIIGLYRAPQEAMTTLQKRRGDKAKYEEKLQALKDKLDGKKGDDKASVGRDEDPLKKLKEKEIDPKIIKKKIDEKLVIANKEFEALNTSLKLELPKLGALTKKLGNLCLAQFVEIQQEWFDIWQKKIAPVIETSRHSHDVQDIVDRFRMEYSFMEGRINELSIVHGHVDGVSSPRDLASTSWEGSRGNSTRSRAASNVMSDDSARNRPSPIPGRSRAISSSESSIIPTPDLGRQMFSPVDSNIPLGLYTGSLYVGPQAQFDKRHSRASSESPASNGFDGFQQGKVPSSSSIESSAAHRLHSVSSPRPHTSRSHTSESGNTRMSSDIPPSRRESGSTYNSASHIDGPIQYQRPFSGIFHSAMPLPDGPDDGQRSSRASSRDHNSSRGYYNVLYLAASLFEFQISDIKREAGYPYLTYQSGEIFDVIGEKGELWLAKNQDDSTDTVGWIWSKHFARLAAD